MCLCVCKVRGEFVTANVVHEIFSKNSLPVVNLNRSCYTRKLSLDLSARQHRKRYVVLKTRVYLISQQNQGGSRWRARYNGDSLFQQPNDETAYDFE